MTTLSKLRSELDNKSISAQELTKIYLDNIKKYDSKINSYITVCEEFALKSAIKAQELIDKSEAKQMTGIPISIKDNICTKGIKTTCASKMLEDFVPFYNATVVEKLLGQNAVILGKTNLDEFGMGDSNKNSYFGAVKNPYNTECVSGGSSGGSAASVAANLAPVSLGTDTGGSVRQPAALCGVTGIRPTYGTVSRFGVVAFASSLDQIGVCAKSAHDAGYVLNSIYGVDQKDSTTSESAKGNYLRLIDMPIKGLKIGIPVEFLDYIETQEMKQSFLFVIDYFKNCGAEIFDVSLPSAKYGIAAYLAISSAEAATNLSKFDGIKYGHSHSSKEAFNELISSVRKDSFGKEVKKRILLGNYVLSEENYERYYNASRDLRNELILEYTQIFKKCDVILSPTTLVPAQKINSPGNNNKQEYSQDIFTVSASLAGLPEITTTCAYTQDNLPIGFSITARPFDDAKIISVADRFEKDFRRKGPVI